MSILRKLAVLDAPSGTPPRPGLPDAVPRNLRSARAMRQHELAARLGARDVGQVELPGCAEGPGQGAIEPERCVAAFSLALAARVREIVSAREFAIVLGDECSILLGNMLGLRTLGRYGLVFVDGDDEGPAARWLKCHRELLTSGGLDLALATGNGPDALSNLHGLRPYVDERHVVLFGMPRAGGAPWREAGEAAAEAVQYLERLGLDGFWIHVDADLLDGAGLSYDELTDALGVFLASGRAVGLELTLDDPELDPEGVSGDLLVESVVRAFERQG